MASRGRILIVDDEANARAALSEILREEGYTTETAADGFKALGKLEEFGPDVVLTDLKMPGLDGIGLMEKAQATQSRASVLIRGETGTGKELIAEMIHRSSPRAKAPLVRLNCAALSESLLESELFGHEKGAFTGAITRREGRFEQAQGGTVFLDEVSEIPMATQVKILRFLHERTCERVGGNETLKVDVRVIAATNRDLKQRIAEGLFRENLYTAST